MKKSTDILIYLSLTLLYIGTSCCEEKIKTEYYPHIHITGNYITEFMVNDKCRTTTEQDTFPIASTISLFSSGDLEVSGVQLIWDGTKWESKQPLQWNNQDSVAKIKAYYPAGIIEPSQFYNESGELIDLLYATHTCQSGSNISLRFQHQFAKITFQLAQSFNRRIQAITFTPSQVITSFDPVAHAFSYGQNTQQISTSQATSPSGNYSLIIPADCPISLSLKIITRDTEYHYLLPEQTYRSGIEYLHTLNYQQAGKGISSVEDFIAFSHLINGYEYADRSLDEFGETVEGETTYRLLKDLTFTEEESSRIKEIGYRIYAYNSKSFDDIFEGNYHTLSGLVLTGQSNNPYFGIFGYIGENGIVRNLIINNLTINTTESKATQIGGIVGFNKGMVDNCIIENSRIESYSEEKVYVAGICCQNNNTVMNCKIKGLTVYGTTVLSAGIVSENNSGTICNCHIDNFRNIKTSLALQICYLNKNGDIANILSSHMSGSKFYHSCSGSVSIANCYYPSTVGTTSQTNNTKQFIPYNEETYQCTSGIDLQSALNQFVDDYHLSLKPWITETDRTVTLNTYGY